MLSLEPEIAELVQSGAISQRDAAPLIARERREIFSLHPELRALSWGGAMMIAAGAGILLAQNLDRIGPVVLATGVAIASGIAYGYAFWRRRTSRTSLVDDYILLLGALLFSADVAFIEGRFHLLDHGWPRHLLVLAVVHGVTAYYFHSRLLLSLSVTALAAWMGIEQRVGTVFRSTTDTAMRAFACSALIVIWRLGHRQCRAPQPFERILEHFAANLALVGGVMLMADDDMRFLGGFMTIVLAGLVIVHGFLVGSEPFVIYSYVYGVAAVMVLVAELMGGIDAGGCGVFLVLLVIAIAGLFRLHDVFRERST